MSRMEKKQSVKRQFTLFSPGDDSVGILTACDCILGDEEFFNKRSAGYEKMIDYDQK
jgi:hypothetical protein